MWQFLNLCGTKRWTEKAIFHVPLETNQTLAWFTHRSQWSWVKDWLQKAWLTVSGAMQFFLKMSITVIYSPCYVVVDLLRGWRRLMLLFCYLPTFHCFKIRTQPVVKMLLINKSDETNSVVNVWTHTSSVWLFQPWSHWREVSGTSRSLLGRDFIVMENMSHPSCQQSTELNDCGRLTLLCFNATTLLLWFRFSTHCRLFPRVIFSQFAGSKTPKSRLSVSCWL